MVETGSEARSAAIEVPEEPNRLPQQDVVMSGFIFRKNAV